MPVLRNGPAWLTQHYGMSVGATLGGPAPTLITRLRTGLVACDGQYMIADVGLRMLAPRELARAQGFPDNYKLIGTKTQQVKIVGNSVSPPPARALIEAQTSKSK